MHAQYQRVEKDERAKEDMKFHLENYLSSSIALDNSVDSRAMSFAKSFWAAVGGTASDLNELLRNCKTKLCGDYLKHVSDQNVALCWEVTALHALVSFSHDTVTSVDDVSVPWIKSDLPRSEKSSGLSLRVPQVSSSTSKPDVPIQMARVGGNAPFRDRVVIDSNSD